MNNTSLREARTCSRCFDGVCHWRDGAWVCGSCSEERRPVDGTGWAAPTGQPQRMAYHPGWIFETDEADWKLWEPHKGHLTWSAAIRYHDEAYDLYHGNFQRRSDPKAAMNAAGFPLAVLALFLDVVQ